MRTRRDRSDRCHTRRVSETVGADAIAAADLLVFGPAATRAPESGQPVRVDDDDLQIVAALQADPRAAWATVGRRVGLSATTASRRWHRLVRDGVAWVSAYPAPQFACVGYCWIEVEPAERRSVGALLAAHPATYWVEALDGGAAYFAGIVGSAPRDLNATVTALGTAPGVASIRWQLARSILHDGTRWTPPGLRADPVDENDGLVWRAAQNEPGRAVGAADIELYRALVVDGRATFLELAERTGLSDRTVRRRLTSLIDGGGLHTRCDVARDMVGLEVGFFISIGWTASWRSVVGAAPRMAGARLVAGVTGDAPFLLHFWARSIADLDRTLGRLERVAADVPIVRIDVATRPIKRFGRLFGPDGRVAGLVGGGGASDVFELIGLPESFTGRVRN